MPLLNPKLFLKSPVKYIVNTLRQMWCTALKKNTLIYLRRQIINLIFWRCQRFVCLLWVQRRFETSEVIMRRCLLVTVVLWPTQECYAADTRHDTPSRHSIQAQGQCGTSHWNTQLLFLMSWVRPDREILPRPSTDTSNHSTLWCCYGGSQSDAREVNESIWDDRSNLNYCRELQCWWLTKFI